MTRSSLTLEEFVEKALEVPFLDRGRSYDGWDCWGVICVAYWDVAGIFVPSYADGYKGTSGREEYDRLERLVATNRQGDWIPARPPFRPLDVPLFRIAGRPIHVGLMVDHQRMVHSEERVGTFIERLGSPMWTKRLEGVYRHADLG